MSTKHSDEDIEAGNNLIRRYSGEDFPRVPRARKYRVGCGLFQTGIFNSYIINQIGGELGNCYLFRGNMKQHYPPQIILIGPDYVFSITAFLLIIGCNLFFIIHQYYIFINYFLVL